MAGDGRRGRRPSEIGAIGGNSLFSTTLLGGVKFPTGNSDLLAEEFVAGPVAGGAAAFRASQER